MSNNSSGVTYPQKKIIDYTDGRIPRRGERIYILTVCGDDVRYKVIGNVPEPPQTSAEIARIKRINNNTLNLMLEWLVRG